MRHRSIDRLVHLDTITASSRDLIHYLKNLYFQYAGIYIVFREHIFPLCKELYFVASEHVESFKHTYNVFHHHPGQPITLVSSRQDYLLPYQHNMSQQQNAQLSSKEGRVQLARSAYTTHQFRSLRRAAEAFNVRHSTLTSRYNGITHILERRNGR
jgi:hypothetical protein